MTNNDNPQQATQIAFNFGPIRGNVEQQHIYPVQPKPTAEQQQSAEQQPQAEPIAEAAEEATGNRLTITQAVILFSALLGEPLEQGYGQEKTKLADLIGRATGYKPSSIRQKIMEIGKMRVYPHNIQQDAEKISKLISDYNPQAANDIRLTYLDD